MSFSQEFIQQVKLANNLVAVANRYMRLEQRGRMYWACCPFHHEKTPSFKIDEQQQAYYCFGCKVHGNVINLVRQLESVDFVGAIELLAKWGGLKMPEVTFDPKAAERLKKRKKILEILDETRAFYCDNISKDAREYLDKRGITDELIKLFNLGQSPDWDALVTHLKGKGYNEPDMLDAGVVKKSDKGGKLYDPLSGRIIFPVFDATHGGCVGFQARVLPANDDGKSAKYLNTAETMVFQKGSTIYGIEVLKEHKRQNKIDRIIVVEGNVDVVSLVGEGFFGTVACMGTAPTANHAKILKRFTDEVHICFDGDTAGRAAALRCIDIFTAEGLDVRVIALPDKTDPDDYIRTNGREAFETLAEASVPAMDYKLDLLARKTNLKDNLGKTKYLAEAKKVLAAIKDEAELELYVPKVADTAGVSHESVKAIVIAKTPAVIAKIPAVIARRATPDEATPRVGAIADNKGYVDALDFVVASKLYKKSYAAAPLGFMLENKLYNDLVTQNMTLSDIDESENLEHFFGFEFKGSDETLARMYTDSIKYLLDHSNKKQISELQAKYDTSSSADEKKKLLTEILALQRKIKGVK